VTVRHFLRDDDLAHDYLLGGATAGMHIRAGSPADYVPDPAVLSDAARIAAGTGGPVAVPTDPEALLVWLLAGGSVPRPAAAGSAG
jgi:ornithine carbamoyltransferase